MDDERFREPAPEDYRRVTNPERFFTVQTAARALIDRLVAQCAVAIGPGAVAEDFLFRRSLAGEVVRLTPERGVGGSLAFLFTDFPGVCLRMGRWHIEAYPVCGCDACDEQPDELIWEMEAAVDAYVARGGLAETLTRRHLGYSLDRADGGSRGRSHLQRGVWKTLGPLGTTVWPRWPTRRSRVR